MHWGSRESSSRMEDDSAKGSGGRRPSWRDRASSNRASGETRCDTGRREMSRFRDRDRGQDSRDREHGREDDKDEFGRDRQQGTASPAVSSTSSELPSSFKSAQMEDPEAAVKKRLAQEKKRENKAKREAEAAREAEERRTFLYGTDRSRQLTKSMDLGAPPVSSAGAGSALLEFLVHKQALARDFGC